MENRKQRTQRYRVACLLLCLVLVLSGCGRAEQTEQYHDAQIQKASNGAGSGMQYEDSEDAEDSADTGEQAVAADIGEGEQTASEAEDASAESGTAEKQTGKADDTASPEQQAQNDGKQVSKEMLVYRGNLSIDTLKFEQSVESFKKLLEQAEGFVETESYSDDGSEGYYAAEEQDKRNIYTATVRVPSSRYDSIMNEAGSLGDVRSKSSRAENVTQQYATYQSEIKIYEAEYQRYLKLLEKAKEDQYALQIEQNLFDLQVKIADIKAGITNIETDVAYSYIDITLREVKKYQEEPEKTDTFLDRLKNTCADSWDTFLYFLENILFVLIYTWYYLAAIAVFAILLFRYVRKHPKQKDVQRMQESQLPVDDGAEEEDSTDVEQEDR